MGNYLDKIIRLERDSGLDDMGYIDRIIAEDFDASKEEGRAVGKMRSAGSVAAKALGGYIEAAEGLPRTKRTSAHANSESPLEHVLVFSLMRMDDITTIPEPELNLDAIYEMVEKRSEPILLFQQPVVCCYNGGSLAGAYRLDFLLTYKKDEYRRMLCVEVDGAHFHHQNIDQVTRDYRRNSNLLAIGIDTVRFTGREVHYDPEACLGVISMIIRGWVAQSNG